jgi:hypothetical protein
MNVAILTTAQKNLLVGQQFAPDSYFYPIQDLNDDWVISEEEVLNCTNSAFSWVQGLAITAYQPKVEPNF